MRMLMIAAVAATALAAGSADAQVMVGGGAAAQPMAGRGWGGGAPVQPPAGHSWGGGAHGQPMTGHTWGGGYIGGRWAAGVRAPGGWNAYRRPYRGWQMPGYWRSPEYGIQNYALFGLAAPPQGYGWSRYYDDAVLMDYDGRVYDSVSGVDWGRADQPYATGYGYPSQGYWNAPDGPGGEDCYRRGRGSGIGGALVGGAIGAGIGAATGGLGATLIGGGLGGLAGQAIDRGSRGRVVCDYGSGYPPAGYAEQGYGYPGYGYQDGDYAYAQGGQGGVVYAPPQPVVQQYGYGYQGGYLPGSSATATVEFDTAPVTTTTTTTTTTEEWVSAPATERVVYRTVVKKVPVYRAPVRKWRPRPQPVCADACECGTVCGS